MTRIAVNRELDLLFAIKLNVMRVVEKAGKPIRLFPILVPIM